MDVQGSQFHLVNGLADWGRCTDVASDLVLADAWAQEDVESPSMVHVALEYDDGLGALRLRHDLPLFRRAGRMLALDPSARRGSGRDAYGNWYWIGDDQASICWRPVDDNVSATWWTAAERCASCAGASADPAAFSSAARPPRAMTLTGLAVTTHHYLAAGYAGDDEQGLLLFDLQAGGEPLRLLWPAPFTPFDLADTADGGLLILDRANAVYFSLDEHFRLRGEIRTTAGPFHPAAGGAPEQIGTSVVLTPNPLYAGSPVGPIDAVSIEPGPGPGTVLVLDSDPARGYSTVHCFDSSGALWSTSLADAIEVIEQDDPSDAPQLYSLLGHDFCYLVDPPATGPLAPPMLYIADAEGKQVVAFTVDAADGVLEAQPDFLPMRRWDGKALVRAGTGAWYDFGDRWVPLEVFTECLFEPIGTLTTPVDFTLAGQSFDSQVPGCVWHRLFLDAQVPSGTSLVVAARGADDPALLVQSPWLPQPEAYLRSDEGELAWYDPWRDLRSADGTVPDGTGTYELLFQGVVGRYLQVQLTLDAGGRSTPAVRSLRAWYPRFSYPEHYLPAVYQEDAAPHAFLERFLANFEGFFTTTEERIEHSSLLLDARTTPVDELAWLACWFGLVLDPQWSEAQQRFLVRNVDQFYRTRGTPTGLMAILTIYLGGELDDSIFECAGTGLGGLRIVERFLTRDGGGAAYGDPDASPGSGSEAERVAGAAHRFDVLVPSGMSSATEAMVDRLVALNKPAHTSYTLQGYFDLFIVGQARLGIDTQLGNSASFTPMVLSQGLLAATYLGFPHPFELTDRIVVDRDRVGDLSPL